MRTSFGCEAKALSPLRGYEFLAHPIRGLASLTHGYVLAPLRGWGFWVHPIRGLASLTHGYLLAPLRG